MVSLFCFFITIHKNWLLKNSDPRICQRLLRESGFEQVTVTGKSGDGEIDGIGICQVNAFVSFKVLFQWAKGIKDQSALH